MWKISGALRARNFCGRTCMTPSNFRLSIQAQPVEFPSGRFDSSIFLKVSQMSSPIAAVCSSQNSWRLMCGLEPEEFWMPPYHPNPTESSAAPFFGFQFAGFRPDRRKFSRILSGFDLGRSTRLSSLLPLHSPSPDPLSSSTAGLRPPLPQPSGRSACLVKQSWVCETAA